MRRIHGTCLLLIATCCFIFVCLGYVELFRNMARRVTDPRSPEFWQVQTLVLQQRDAAQEARTAFQLRNDDPFDLNSLVTPAQTWYADQVPASDRRMPVVQGSFGSGSWLERPARVDDPARDYRRFLNKARQFAAEYNRELDRLRYRR